MSITCDKLYNILPEEHSYYDHNYSLMNVGPRPHNTEMGLSQIIRKHFVRKYKSIWECQIGLKFQVVNMWIVGIKDGKPG